MGEYLCATPFFCDSKWYNQFVQGFAFSTENSFAEDWIAICAALRQNIDIGNQRPRRNRTRYPARIFLLTKAASCWESKPACGIEIFYFKR